MFASLDGTVRARMGGSFFFVFPSCRPRSSRPRSGREGGRGGAEPARRVLFFRPRAACGPGLQPGAAPRAVGGGFLHFGACWSVRV